jgi:hypothetical protein
VIGMGFVLDKELNLSGRGFFSFNTLASLGSTYLNKYIPLNMISKMLTKEFWTVQNTLSFFFFALIISFLALNFGEDMVSNYRKESQQNHLA